MRLFATLALVASLMALPVEVSAREDGEASSGEDSGSETESSDTEQSPKPGAEKPEAGPAAAESTEAAEPQTAPKSSEGPAAESAAEPETAAADAVLVEPVSQPDLGSVADDAPSSSALAALRHALDQVASLQSLLAEGHDGEGPIPGQSQLDDVRRALQDSLVEVARLEQDASLRQWLEGEGLKAALAEVERSAVPEVVAAEDEAEFEDQTNAIEAKRLRGVKRAIEDAPFKEGKMQVLTDQLQNVHLSTEQVSELIELFAFSRDKVEALVFLYPRLVDPERFEDLLSSLKFASDRIAVRQRLGLGGS